jgi:8-hydroxy-5-deazaflavin:NADPH oxidoreductase
VRIAIIGAGNVGSALGTRWTTAGHEVMFGVREPSNAKVRALVSALGPTARVGKVAEVATFGEVIVLATPFEQTDDAIRRAGDLSGKVVIDATNPLAPNLAGLTVGHTSSGGEMVAGWAKGARVVKTLNTTGAGNMTDPQYGLERATMFLCGDDSAAKTTVASLVEALGFDVVDAGPLRAARLLEPLAMLWISLAYAQRNGPDIAFRLMRREASK